MYEYFGVGPQVQEDVDGIYPRFLRLLPKYHLSTLSKHSPEVLHTVIDNLTMADVSLSFFFMGGFWCLIVVWSSFHFGFFVIFMSFNPWLGCEEYAECEWALELNSRQVLFECGHERY
ncbi:hypothetical protein ACB092_08G070000 [Castanea dentata]